MPVTALGDPLSAGDISRPQDRYTVGGKGEKKPQPTCVGEIAQQPWEYFKTPKF